MNGSQLIACNAPVLSRVDFRTIVGLCKGQQTEGASVVEDLAQVCHISDGPALVTVRCRRRRDGLLVMVVAMVVNALHVVPAPIVGVVAIAAQPAQLAGVQARGTDEPADLWPGRAGGEAE